MNDMKSVVPPFMTRETFSTKERQSKGLGSKYTVTFPVVTAILC